MQLLSLFKSKHSFNCFCNLNKNKLFIKNPAEAGLSGKQLPVYASAKLLTGSQVQMRFLSPCVLFTLATLGQNLLCVT
jgi:hypothetical protein